MEQPFAELSRPQTFDAVLGQDAIWAPGAPLRQLVEKDRFFSLIFWGPPGCGKTTLANLIGKSSGRSLIKLSAVNAGVKDIREAIQSSEDGLQFKQKCAILFMDEVHRLSKNQQDVLLPALELGSIRFIGATTENPSFEVNSAVNSRSLVFRLHKISPEAMVPLLSNALTNPQSPYRERRVEAEALAALAASSDGDARRALNFLEAVLASLGPEKDPLKREDLALLKEVFPTLVYDKHADQHYDAASALIKCIRASQPDAAMYYLARMLDAGEQPEFIARRLVIAAAEDIGSANPHALTLAVSAAQAAHMVGMPEARIILAHACAFLAQSPKSNRSYVAIDQALADVRKLGSLEIPLFLRNAPTQMMKDFGYGKGYIYAHDDPEGARKLDYLPKELKGRRYFP